MGGFHEATQAWFSASFAAPTRVQELGWPLIQRGESALLLAPTGSGKTLAAFLAAIDRLMFGPVPPTAARCRVLYLSPLRALAVDVERNLQAPLAGVARWAERLGVAARAPEIAIRTGDTPHRDRARFARAPADILITTPESLYLLLTSQARDALRGVETVIVDEVHALIGTKRGAHLALSLERLAALTGRPLQRVGLSATQRPLEEAARFIGGFDGGEPRPVHVVDAGSRKALDLRVEVPVEDMARLGEAEEIPGGPAAPGARGSSIWSAMHPLILDLIRGHRSTLVFANSRRLAERLAASLNELAGEVIVHAHHGSVAREQRTVIEERLKRGELPAIVATSSLELGIDMGAIDLVIHVEAPPSVTSGLQRIGRAGHQIGVPSAGVILPKYRGDLLACAALIPRMREGQVEPLTYPRNALDVLAQQIVAMVSMEEWEAGELERVIRRAAPYAELPRPLLDGVLDMLSGRYPSDEFAELRPRIAWDRLGGRLRAREGAKRIAIASGGTIPDRGLYGVFLADAEKGRGRVGELDEEMVFESREGETFLLGASTWRIEDITHDRVLVSPAPGIPGKMPFWHGDAAGRSAEIGRAIGALTRAIRTWGPGEAVERLVAEHALSPTAAQNLVRYVADQVEAAGAVPDDWTLVVERYRDEMGDWRLCLLSPHGGRVHGPWAMAVAAMARERSDVDHDILWTDDGIVARFPETDEPPPVEAVLPDPDEVEALVIRQLGSGGAARAAGQGAPAVALFAARFREAAARALLLPRRHPGQRVPLWQQRKRAGDLLAVASRFDAFPIVLETYREILRDVFDMPALVSLLRDIRSRAIRVVTVDARTPSPFAAALTWSYVANFLYEGDSPIAERRAQALTVDPGQLRQLLGEVELRELLDPEVLAELEAHLQHLTTERAARHADGVHDLLLQLGDLSREEILARSASPEAAGDLLDELVRARRIVPLAVRGEPRYAAGEDVGRYRDGLGVPPPPGLPPAFLEPVRDALGDLVGRYARTHGPFRVGEVAARLGLGVAAAEAVLERLAEAGRVVPGEFRPGAVGAEWCDAGVLRTLRQRSLARLRREVEPVEAAVLGRLYAAWQGVSPAVRQDRRGVQALLDVVAQLQGTAIPASVLETEVLPARLPHYDPRELDQLMASGAVVWMGAGSLGPRDGKVSLYLTEGAPLLAPPSAASADGPLHQRVQEYLAARGASFFPQIVLGVSTGGPAFVPDMLEALWDLVWAGLVTNDTLLPLRALVRPRDRRTGGKRAARALRGPGGRPGVAASGRGFAPETAGRWSLVASLVSGTSSATEVAAARARQLLDRHGVLTREAVAAEGVPGGFGAVYGVLRAMEDAGRVRRGYFVAGRGAAQFAAPGAVDRLRALRSPGERIEVLRLAATDPANPYGAALPWPERASGRKPMRVAGALVILVDGMLAAWMGPRERQLLSFVDLVEERSASETAAEVARALAREPLRTGRPLVIEEVDGQPVAESPMAGPLRDAGFTATGHGFIRRPTGA
ncbi:MAG: DEAD/DEAH box helicase [Candidatus Rokubacteria bacterium]|nr:DEAD/DEAH box helicase [Candidatus Rokubacteria bacterium]